MRSFLTLSLLASSLGAQSIVSPGHFTNTEGNTGLNIPFPTTTLYRYLQVHDDVTGSPRTIRGMRFRRDGFTSTAAIVPQAFVVNGWMSTAVTTAATVNTTFDLNHGTDKTQVLSNQVINFPRSDNALPLPNPFDFNIPFGVPFNHGGAAGLCWEIVIPSRAATASGNFDAASSSSTNPALVHVSYGTGCRSTGHTTAMALTTSSTTNWTTRVGQLNFNGLRAPANGLVLVVLGTSNSSFSGLPLPFLVPGSSTNLSGPCHIYTSMLAIVVGLANASGGVGPVAQPIPLTNDLAGGTVYSQFWAIDPPAAFGFSMSNAYASHWVAPYTNVPVGRLSATSVGAPTGTRVLNSGLVTRFDL